MQKKGKFKAFRNIPVGFILQAIHSTDKSERIFRISVEIMIFIILYYVLNEYQISMHSSYRFVLLFLIVHGAVFLLSGNFLVYLLDSFSFVKNQGIFNVVAYVKICRKYFVKFDVCEAILIYGSMCRCEFHSRSDLDLRIIRKVGIRCCLISLVLGYLLRIYSLFKLIPVDLQVVDSMSFLNFQMREDEEPIVVYCSPGFNITNAGLDFYEVERNPTKVLKNT